MSTLILPVAAINQQASCSWLKGCLALGIAAVTVATVVVVAIVVEDASGWTGSSAEIISIHDDIGLEMKEKLFKEVKEGWGKTSVYLCL